MKPHEVNDLPHRMQEATSAAPSTSDIASIAIKSAKAKRRRRLALSGLGLAAGPIVAFGILNATTVAATVPLEAKTVLAMSVTVDCRANGQSGGVNSGSPDYAPDSFDRRPPLAQAGVFVAGTGMDNMFPGLVPVIHSTPSPRTTIVQLTEPSGASRGALQYYGSGSDGWQLVHAQYC